MERRLTYYRFTIDAYTPETLPMARLAEYISDLADLFGHKENVHFLKLEKGSAVPVIGVDFPTAPKVRERLHLVRNSEGPPEALRAYHEIDKRLAQDNATGGIRESRAKHELIAFPGRDRKRSLIYGPFNQPGTIYGELIKVGGEQDIVPVHIEEARGRVHICQANRAMARKVAQHLFGPPLRLHGQGRWERDEAGNWQMRRFTIESFEVLDNAALSKVVQKLRAIDGPLKRVTDPFQELEKLRHG